MAKKWDRMTEVVGFSAVVVTMGLLVFELNQANRLAEAIEERELLEAYNELNLSMATDPEFADFFVSMRLADQTGLSPQDQERAIALAFYLRNVWDAVAREYELGIVSQRRYELALVDVRSWTQDYPKFRPFLRAVVKPFSEIGKVGEIDKAILEATEDDD